MGKFYGIINAKEVDNNARYERVDWQRVRFLRANKSFGVYRTNNSDFGMRDIYNSVFSRVIRKKDTVTR